MHQTELRRREIGNKEMSFMDAAAPPFLLRALRSEACLVTLCGTINHQAVLLQQLLLGPPVDVVRNWRAQVEPVCKFITFLGDLGASAFLHQPDTTSISTHTSHHSSLDSIAAVSFGLGDATATFHKGNGGVKGRGV
jgi:hypothetical protein